MEIIRIFFGILLGIIGLPLIMFSLYGLHEIYAMENPPIFILIIPFILGSVFINASINVLRFCFKPKLPIWACPNCKFFFERAD